MTFTKACFHMHYPFVHELYKVFVYYRKVLEEKNRQNSDSFHFRIYILVLGVYAALRLFLALMLKFPACHALSDMSDQSFFQFFKWIYQASSTQSHLLTFAIKCLVMYQMTYTCEINLVQERYYVGRGLFEKMSDYCRFVFMILSSFSNK